MHPQISIPLLSLLLFGCHTSLKIPGSLQGLGRSPTPYFVHKSHTSEYAFPVLAEHHISSPFGMRIHPITNISKMHNGVDIAAPKGTPIYPIAKGTTVFSGNQTGYGKIVIVDHGAGVTSRYAHCDTLNTNVGDTVEPNTKIASVGNTGSATGYHLHLEIRTEDTPIDPLPLLQDTSRKE